MRIAVVGLLAGVAVGAPDAMGAVKPGEKAPPLMVTDWIKLNPFGDWVKSKPLDLANSAKGRVVLIEFWATWCAPCVQLIPHNNELYHRYKDKGLVFVSLTDTSRGQQLSTVKRFVDGRGAQMDYPVAFDETQQSILTYAADEGGVGLPHAVLIGKDGTVVWAGHPAMPAMESILKDLLLDRYDPATIQKKAQREARLEPVIRDFNQAASVGDWGKCVQVAEKMLEIDPDNRDAIDLSVQIYLNEIRDRDRFRAWVSGLIDRFGDHPDTMLTLARVLVGIDALEQREPDLALQAVQAAYAKRPQDAGVVQTLAAVAYQLGDLERAIALQREAVRVADILAVDGARDRLAYLQKCRSLRPRLRQTIDSGG